MLFASIVLVFLLTPLRAASQLGDLVIRDGFLSDPDPHFSDQVMKDSGNLTVAFDELPTDLDIFKRQLRCNPGWGRELLILHPLHCFLNANDYTAPCPSMTGCCKAGDT